MAKAKKKAVTKSAKKKPAVKAKSKPAAKAKKATSAKSPKRAVKKAIVAKKAAVKKKEPLKKVAEKKSVIRSVIKKEVKTVVKKSAPVKVKEEVAKPIVTKVAPVAVKPTPPLSQLNMFQMPNQRPIAHKPAKSTTQDNRTRYSEDELKEFEKLIFEKLEKAREEYKILKETLNRNNDEGTDATSGGNTKVLEDGAETAEKENLSQLAARQQKYITNLENALVRIKNGTYGICSVTGKLISKERLIAVPHTTQSIEAKMMQQD